LIEFGLLVLEKIVCLNPPEQFSAIRRLLPLPMTVLQI
jgi:hypothetical protein